MVRKGRLRASWCLWKKRTVLSAPAREARAGRAEQAERAGRAGCLQRGWAGARLQPSPGRTGGGVTPRARGVSRDTGREAAAEPGTPGPRAAALHGWEGSKRMIRFRQGWAALPALHPRRAGGVKVDLVISKKKKKKKRVSNQNLSLTSFSKENNKDVVGSFSPPS